MVRIYIHGRPQGQDSWSSVFDTNDKYYLSPFLDSRIGNDISAVMQVDLWQKNSYYSYIHRKNVLEKGNRPSSYFAITVCFKTLLCTQVAILYDLLERVFNQLCLNNLIEKVGDQEHFLVSHFKEKESVLMQITSIIHKNIEKYILDRLVPITDIMRDTTNATIKTYSIDDVDSPQFISDCSANRVLISPAYSTKDKLHIELEQQIAIIENQRKEVEKERNLWQSRADHQQSENENLTAKQKQLQEQCDSLQRKLDKLQKGKNPIPNNPYDFKGKEFSDIPEQLQEIKNEVRRMAGRLPKLFQTITMVSTLLNSAILITLVVFARLWRQENNNTNSIEIDRVTPKTPIAEQHPQIKEQPIEFMTVYSNARIDIKELYGATLKVGKQYTLALVNVKYPQQYKWAVDGNDVVLENNLLMVNSTGDIIIKCIDSHNYIVKQRKIKVQ